MSAYVPVIEIYSPQGVRLGQVEDPRDVSRAFSRRGFESASFTVERTEALADEMRPARGNYVVISSPIYPLRWVGFISALRGERDASIIEAQLDSLGTLLRERSLPSAATFTGSATQAFEQVIAMANGQAPTGVTVGYVSKGAPTIPSSEPLALGYSQVGDALDQLAEVAGWDWWVDFEADDEGVIAQASFAPWRGADKANEVSLYEGGQADVIDWSEDYTRQSWAVQVVGGQQHATQVVEDLPAARRDQLSAETAPTPFGLVPDSLYDGSGPATRREALVVMEGLKAQGLTEAAAVSELLALSRLPPRRVRLAIKQPNAWQNVLPGDLVRLTLSTPFVDGYTGLGRVEAVQPDEVNGRVAVLFSLWREKDAA